MQNGLTPLLLAAQRGLHACVAALLKELPEEGDLPGGAGDVAAAARLRRNKRIEAKDAEVRACAAAAAAAMLPAL